jgi:hypothetical protein
MRQLWQAAWPVVAANVPALQFWHDEEPAVLNIPREQLVQAVMEDAPVPGLIVPPGQLKQELKPELGWYLPELQGAQTGSPLTAEVPNKPRDWKTVW